MNAFQCTGRIVRDPELMKTQTGKSCVNFTLAVKRPFTKDKADFIRFKAWDNTAEFVSKYFKKGSPMAVIGYLTIQEFEDKKGEKVSFPVVCCDRCEFVEQQKEATAAADTTETEKDESFIPEGFEEYFKAPSDLPF